MRRCNQAALAAKLNNNNYVVAKINLMKDVQMSDMLKGKSDLVLEVYLSFNDVHGATRM